MTSGFNFAPLGPGHDRAGFDCGIEALNRYLLEIVSQDIRRLVTKCFVACPFGSAAIAGFYTLAASELPLSGLSQELARKLPRYPFVPVVRMGRLAVDVRYKGRGLGAGLVADALGRITASDVGAYALAVDAKDDAAEAFYRHLGFQSADPLQRVLFLPMATWRKVQPKP